MTEPRTIPLSRVQKMLALPPDTLVRVYTHQHASAVREAELRGYLTGEHPYADSYLRQGYEWMRNQMSECIENFSGDLPVWAWAKRPYVARKRNVDARDDRVRVTAMVPRGRFIVSCFHDWHNCLNRSPIVKSHREYDEYEKTFPLGSRDPQEDDYVVSTWHRVFEFENRTDAEELEWRGSNKKAIPQLCIDRIYWDEVIRVRDWS